MSQKKQDFKEKINSFLENNNNNNSSIQVFSRYLLKQYLPATFVTPDAPKPVDTFNLDTPVESSIKTIRTGIFTDPLYYVDFVSAYPSILVQLTGCKMIEYLIRLKETLPKGVERDKIKAITLNLYGNLKYVDEPLRKLVTQTLKYRLIALADYLNVQPISTITDAIIVPYSSNLAGLREFQGLNVTVEKFSFSIIESVNSYYAETDTEKVFKGSTFKHDTPLRTALIAKCKGLLPYSNVVGLTKIYDKISLGNLPKASDLELESYIETRNLNLFSAKALSILKLLNISSCKGNLSYGYGRNQTIFHPIKRNYSGSKITSFPITVNSDITIAVESFSNALGLASLGYNAVILSGSQLKDTLLEQYPAITHIWLDTGMEAIQAKFCKAHNIKAVYIPENISKGLSNYDINDMISSNYVDSIHQLIEDATAKPPKHVKIEPERTKKTYNVDKTGSLLDHNLQQLRDSEAFEDINNSIEDYKFTFDFCPFSDLHSLQNNSPFAIYIDKVTGKPSISCFHGSCRSRIADGKGFEYYKALGLNLHVDAKYINRDNKQRNNKSSNSDSDLDLESATFSQIEVALAEIELVKEKIITPIDKDLEHILGLAKNSIVQAPTGSGKTFLKVKTIVKSLIGQIQVAEEKGYTVEEIYAIWEACKYNEKKGITTEVVKKNRGLLYNLFPFRYTFFDLDTDKIKEDYNNIINILTAEGYKQYQFLVICNYRGGKKQNKLHLNDKDSIVRSVISVAASSYLNFQGDSGFIYNQALHLVENRYVHIDELGIFLNQQLKDLKIDYHAVLKSSGLFMSANSCRMKCLKCARINSDVLKVTKLHDNNGVWEHDLLSSFEYKDIVSLSSVTEKERMKDFEQIAGTKLLAKKAGIEHFSYYSDSLKLPKGIPENDLTAIDVANERLKGYEDDMRTQAKYLYNATIVTYQNRDREGNFLTREETQTRYRAGKVERGDIDRTKSNPCSIRTLQGYNTIALALLKKAKGYKLTSATISSSNISLLRACGICEEIVTAKSKVVATFSPQIVIQESNISNAVLATTLSNLYSKDDKRKALIVTGSKLKAQDLRSYLPLACAKVSSITERTQLESKISSSFNIVKSNLTFAFLGSPILYGFDIPGLNLLIVDALNYKPLRHYLSACVDFSDATVAKAIAKELNEELTQIVGRGLRTKKDNIVAGKVFEDNKPYVIYIHNAKFLFLQKFKIDDNLLSSNSLEAIKPTAKRIGSEKLTLLLETLLRKEDYRNVLPNLCKGKKQVKKEKVREKKQDRLADLKLQIKKLYQSGKKWKGTKGIAQIINFKRLTSRDQKTLTSYYYRESPSWLVNFKSDVFL